MLNLKGLPAKRTQSPYLMFTLSIKNGRLAIDGYGLGMDALVTYAVCTWDTNVISYGRHGCPGKRIRLEHEGFCGLGMDALVNVCT